jgi:hypothetical protein
MYSDGVWEYRVTGHQECMVKDAKIKFDTYMKTIKELKSDSISFVGKRADGSSTQ